ADAAVVERYLGATVHAIVVRDRATANAIRAWHAAVDPGPLCLLPLDAVTDVGPQAGPPDAESGASGPASAIPARSLASRVTPAPALQSWVAALLGRVRELGDGAAFEDAQGAIWLPGTPAGRGPLQRRAELAALRAEHVATGVTRDAAANAAGAARAALAEAESRAAAAEQAAAAT